MTCAEYAREHSKLEEDLFWLTGRLAEAPEQMGDHVPELGGLALPIFKTRCKDSCHRIGASDVVPETIEASLQLSEAVLVDVGTAMGPVIASIHEQRAALQADIKAMVPPHVEIRPLGRRRLRDAIKRGG